MKKKVQKTRHTKPADIQENWFVLDGDDKFPIVKNFQNGRQICFGEENTKEQFIESGFSICY